MNLARTLISLLLDWRPSGGYVPFNGHATLGVGLESYWKLDELSGVRYDSITATGNDLTDINTVTSTTGKMSLGAEFTAANVEHLQHADSASLRVGVADFTFSFWYKRTLDTGILTAVLSKGTQQDYTFDTNPASQKGMRLYTSNGGSFPVATWGSALTLDTFYFVVGWRDGTAETINIQVDNGTPVSAATGAVVDGDTATTFNVGTFANNGSAVNGVVDEVGFWKRVLTAPERTALYNGGAGLTY